MTNKMPIDIHYKQILETLLDRRIVPKKWLEQHKHIRDAIAALYPELPRVNDQLSQFCAKKPKDEDLNYFDCKFIVQCLEQSDEGAAKNIFGQYTSPVVRRWDALLRQYVKNNIFVAESARHIAQNTAFEIPFLKKSIQQNEKQVADNNRKIGDLIRSIAEYKRKLETSCADLGIAGENFGEELRRLSLELPEIFDKVAKAIWCDEIANAIEYHQALQTYLHHYEMPAVTSTTESSSLLSSKKGEKRSEVVEESGATTEKLVVASHNFFDALKELYSASDELPKRNASVDFKAEATAISWDISVNEDCTVGMNELDWDIETVASTDAVTTSNDVPVEIDWEITTVDMAKPVDEMNHAEATDAMETVQKMPATAKTITRVELLDENEFRTRVLNDLLELRAFLRERLLELSGSTSVAFANQFQGSSPQLEQQSSAKIEEYKAAVDNAIFLLTNKRLQQLVLFKTSERYLARQVASLEILTRHMDKCRREIHALEDRNVALIDATKNVHPQINALATSTKMLKKELEAVLPSLFKGHKVNIVGEVNSLYKCM